MKDTMENCRHKIAVDGFAIIDDFFDEDKVASIAGVIANAGKQGSPFRQTGDLYAVRQVLQEVPGLSDIIFTTAFTTLIHRIFGEDYFVVRSIYFNKPGLSNWFVAYHQDLSISVNGQYKMHGFKNWTNKQGQWAVQPPAEILENMFTIRIHLDDTDEYNGALKVIPGSHKTGMRSRLPVDKGDETICRVAKGGIMLMKPLLLHSSAKTTNNQSRRVIHVEFSNRQLPAPLAWREAMQLPAGSFL